MSGHFTPQPQIAPWAAQIQPGTHSQTAQSAAKPATHRVAIQDGEERSGKRTNRPRGVFKITAIQSGDVPERKTPRGANRRKSDGAPTIREQLQGLKAPNDWFAVAGRAIQSVKNTAKDEGRRRNVKFDVYEAVIEGEDVIVVKLESIGGSEA